MPAEAAQSGSTAPPSPPRAVPPDPAASGLRPLCLGLLLVFGPIAVLVGVHTASGSAPLAAAVALGASPALQLAAERRWPRHAWPPASGAQRAREVFMGVAYGTVLGVGVTVGLWAGVIALRGALGIELAVGGAVWTQALLLVVLADFLDYFRHRHEHESSGLFWRVHSVHHSIRRFSLLDGLALHPLETVFTYTSYGLVAGVLGLSFDALFLGFALALIVMGAQHTNTETTLGRLSNVLAHADGHRWHHDIALESGRNVNYANVFALWDRLWGSFYAPRPFDGEYGITPFRDDYPRGLVEQALLALPARYEAAERAARRPDAPAPG